MQMYLLKYGYIDGPTEVLKSSSPLSEEGLKDFIREFQAFAGLPKTGVLDEDTVKLMKIPRCGVKDNIGNGRTTRKKRFILEG